MMTHMERCYYYSKGDQLNRFPKASRSCTGAASAWDCGSTLYDSYELNSFKRQIDSAIANSPRTHSMPHLQEPRRFSDIQPHQYYQTSRHHQLSSSSWNKSFKISRPFQKLLRFVFKSSSSNNNNNNKPSSISGSTINNTTTTLASNYNYNNNNNKMSSSNFQKEEKYSKEGLYVVYDNTSDQPVLSTIPELPEIEIMGGGAAAAAGLSPENITSLVKKSASKRFPPTTSIGISCA